MAELTANRTFEERGETERIEIELLLEAVYRKYGYDYRDYSRASLRRRLRRRLGLDGWESFSQMQHRVLRDSDYFAGLLRDLSVSVTEMFRDPEVYAVLRREVVPLLKTYPFVRIWHAGCCTGEEVYSMAIMLIEEGLYDRTRIYATDISDSVIAQAREGRIALEKVKDFTTNYHRAGGEEEFSDYYSVSGQYATIANEIKRNVVFSTHNLVTDGVFNEMNMVVCRNVLIYFNRRLQGRVLGLFARTLCRNGFLCLGTKETLEFAECRADFEPISLKNKVYRRIR
ncbi:MAG: protein-glutamate O-methyltransferase CheR [Candidatus Schekmanbacteria bacterium]|nr:protein-glutamate O-methyltransferase CheR [Candidatus Schekmanbacteria bacterium]